MLNLFNLTVVIIFIRKARWCMLSLKQSTRLLINWYNFTAIRSGDYYMFDDFEDDEIDLLPEETAVEKESKVGEKPNMSEVGDLDRID